MEKGSDQLVPPLIDALVSSVGHRAMTKELLSITRDLWSIGISADVYLDATQSLEEVKDHCRANRVSYLVVLKDSDCSIFKVRQHFLLSFFKLWRIWNFVWIFERFS